MENENGKNYGRFILLWLSLVVTMCISVAVSSMNLGSIKNTVVLTITAIQSCLIIIVFAGVRINNTTGKVFTTVSVVFLFVLFILIK